MACSKCGETGHYAKTCPGKGVTKRAAKPAGRAPKRTTAHVAPLPVAGDLASGAATVRESLEARAQQLRAAIAAVDPMRHELGLIEKVLEELGAIGGAA